ncbi:MAG: ABC transporter permease [Acidobacteria bacterium]|nr:ABC transporter permease [Acidobacteriota bacterium]
MSFLAILNQVFRDLRLALRLFRRNPVFTAIAIATLALGIGANTAVFSIVNAVMFRPLPYRAPSQLGFFWEGRPGWVSDSKIFASYRDLREWQTHSRQLESLAGYTWAVVDSVLTGSGEPHSITAIPVTTNLFGVLGVNAQYGRTFLASDEAEDCTIVLSHRFWQNELGSDASRLGSMLQINGAGCRIVGVMPASFSLHPAGADLWMLADRESFVVTHPDLHILAIVGRLAAGATLSAAAQELSALRQGMEAHAPDSMRGLVVNPYELHEELAWLTGRNLRSGLLLLLGVVGFVLLMACLNIANLVLEFASRRRQEFAIRAALGCSRWRLGRQMVTETLLLALLGGLLGAGLAAACLSAFRAARPVALPGSAVVALDYRVLLFTLLITGFSGVLFGIFPAIQVTRSGMANALRQGTRGTPSRAHRSLEGLLVIGQVSLCLVLLVGASLLIQSAIRMAKAPLGIRGDHVLLFTLALPQSSAAGSAKPSTELFDEAVARVRALPGVLDVAYGSGDPLAIAGVNAVNIEGMPQSLQDDVCFTPVSGNYLKTLGVPLLQGRAFEPGDSPTSPAVAVVNRAFVRRYLQNENPIGKRIQREHPRGPWLSIIGVAEDTRKRDALHEMAYLTPPQVYVLAAQQPPQWAAFAARTSGDPMSLAPSVRHALAAVNSSWVPQKVASIEERLDEITAAARLRARLLGAFAALGLLLAVIGIYGLVAQTVTDRRHEIGIRLALGAQRLEILKLVLGQGTQFVAIGAAFGAVAALALGRLMDSFLFGIQASDPAVVVTGTAVLALSAALAMWVPAVRSSKVDPATVLRDS